jgi:hypothetical protein
MSAFDADCLVVTMHIRGLRGKSRPILVQGSDGHTYVLKHYFNPQTTNQAFNEGAGTELYRAYGLSVPQWQPLFLSDELIRMNPELWNSGTSGVCFGSRFLPESGRLCYEIFPSSHKAMIRNRSSFWLAWLIDVCCHHSANRKVIFQEKQNQSFEAFFIDHDQMFNGFRGNDEPGAFVSRNLSLGLCSEINPEEIREITRKVLAVDTNLVWSRVHALPQSWETRSALKVFSETLDRLSTERVVEDLLAKLADFHCGLAEAEHVRPHHLCRVILCVDLQSRLQRASTPFRVDPFLRPFGSTPSRHPHYGGFITNPEGRSPGSPKEQNSVAPIGTRALWPGRKALLISPAVCASPAVEKPWRRIPVAL